MNNGRSGYPFATLERRGRACMERELEALKAKQHRYLHALNQIARGNPKAKEIAAAALAEPC